MKRIANLALILLPCILAFSCKEKEPVVVEKAVLGVDVLNLDGIVEVPMRQNKTFDVRVVADPGPAEALTVTIGPGADMVSKYNLAYGTDYQMLPADAYELPTTPFVIPRYNKESPTAQLRLKGSGCEIDKVYVLPIVITKAEGAEFEAPEDNVAYVRFKMTPAQQEGAGTVDDPYLINDLDEFLKMDNLLKDGETVCFKLMADIDLSSLTFTAEEPWKPINFATDDEAKAAARKRKIEFDGNNHKLSGFTGGGPMFAILVGSVKNLTVENFNITSDADDAATVVGVAGASDDAASFTMKNVVVKSSKVENDYKRSGALIAHLRNGVVEDCSADCSVTAQQQAGGLIGRVDNGSVINCSASGSATTEAYYCGGLIGYTGDITVKGCSATGSAASLSGNYSRAGGLIGQIEGNATIEKCFATGNVQGEGHMAGGLIGVVGADDITVSISKCYATGSVTLPHGESGNWAHAGGLLGTIAGKGTGEAPIVNIDNCYSTGAIAVRRYSGGFMGSIYSKPAKLNVTNSYTTSDISGIVLADRCGSFIGSVDAMDKGTAVTCKGFVAWDTSARGFSYGDSVPVEGNYWGTEGTVSQQASKLGWDSSVWDLSGNEPKLK